MDKRIKLVWLISLTVLFMTGMWLTDLGSSAIALEASGVPVYAQTLMTSYSPNTIYHIGLILCGLIWLIGTSWLIFEIIGDGQ